MVANPPYMGSNSLNRNLKEYAKKHYSESKADLYAMFIERCSSLTADQRMTALLAMHSWMFISTYEQFRQKVLATSTSLTVAHLGARAFSSIWVKS